MTRFRALGVNAGRISLVTGPLAVGARSLVVIDRISSTWRQRRSDLISRRGVAIIFDDSARAVAGEGLREARVHR